MTAIPTRGTQDKTHWKLYDRKFLIKKDKNKLSNKILHNASGPASKKVVPGYPVLYVERSRSQAKKGPKIMQNFGFV